MDYNNFLLFISDKGLRPRETTDAEAAKEDAKQKNFKVFNAKNRKWNWFSLKSIAGGVKGIWKKINEGLDQYNKDQVDAFNDRLIDDL
ncbi:MAG: hypothetical protein LBH96_02415 [Candidatus Peribacteria bacterium]|jgi:predicted ATP-grasp superfamily ATP-dependent carboligase|nr:hypothetical protein [Candidatus Peribacteria bacterium]